MIIAIVMGAAGGVVSGLLGVGGGILFVPALTLAVSLSQVRAEATSLLAIIPVALVGAARQYRYGNVEARDGMVLGGLSAVGVLAGVGLANVLPERVLKLSFAGLMVIVAGQFLRRYWRARRAADEYSSRR
ncbi:MAG: TSUP family transporter [Solirubrobacteraceae bacterium]